MPSKRPKPRVFLFPNAGNVDPQAVSEALYAAAAVLRSDDAVKATIGRPSRSYSQVADRGSGVSYTTSATSLEIYHRENYATRHVIEYTIRQNGKPDQFIVMPPPRLLTALRERFRMAKHLEAISDHIARTRAWDATPEDMAISDKFDQICELAAISAGNDPHRFKAPATPIECPGPFETLPHPFASKDGEDLIITGEFKKLCRETVGALMILRRDKDESQSVHEIQALRNYVGSTQQNPVDILRAMNALPKVKNLDNLVAWQTGKRVQRQ